MESLLLFGMTIGAIWGRLRNLLGARAYIDMGIPECSTVTEALQKHKRRRHRIVILNKVEEEIERLKSESIQAEDIAVWRNKAKS